MTVAAFAPPRTALKRDQVALWNALLSYRGAPLPLAGRNVTAVFEPASRAPLDGPALRVKVGDGEFLLVLTRFPFKRVFDSEFSVEDLASLPEGLRGVMCEGVLNLIWQAMPEKGLGRPVLVESGDAGALLPSLQGALVWFDVAVAGLFPEPVDFLFGCEQGGLLRALGPDGIGPRVLWPELKTRLTQTASIAIGQVELSVAQARALAVGDVVLLPEKAQERRAVAVNGAHYEFSQAGRGWACSAPARSSKARGDHVDQSSLAEGAADLGVTLDFEIAQQIVSLAEIESWTPGAVVALETPEPANGVEIKIRSGGWLIATGDLVRIDDRLAVRINKVLLAPKA